MARLVIKPIPRKTFDARIAKGKSVRLLLQKPEAKACMPNHYPNARVSSLEDRVKTIEDNPGSGVNIIFDTEFFEGDGSEETPVKPIIDNTLSIESPRPVSNATITEFLNATQSWIEITSALSVFGQEINSASWNLALGVRARLTLARDTTLNPFFDGFDVNFIPDSTRGYLLLSPNGYVFTLPANSVKIGNFTIPTTGIHLLKFYFYGNTFYWELAGIASLPDIMAINVNIGNSFTPVNQVVAPNITTLAALERLQGQINGKAEIIVNHIFTEALVNDAITYNLGAKYRYIQVIIHQVGRNDAGDALGLNVRINGVASSVYHTLFTPSTVWGINCGRFNTSNMVLNISAPGNGRVGGNWHFKYYTAADAGSLLHRNVSSDYHADFVDGVESFYIATTGHWAVGTSVTIIGAK